MVAYVDGDGGPPDSNDSDDDVMFFAGLAHTGTWCCFNEFNRNDVKVLSVIAQKLISIRNAKALKMSRLMFGGRKIKLLSTCAMFIMMNPGFAGRTELLGNLRRGSARSP